MEKREPNSKGFWRRNAIIGLRETLAETVLAAYADPEALALFQQRAQELQQLDQAERRVRDCARRLHAAPPSP